MDLTYDGPGTGSACGATLSLGTRVRSGAGDVCWTSCVGGWIGSDAGGVVAGRGNRVWRRSVSRRVVCRVTLHARLFQTSTKHRALMRAQVTGPKRGDDDAHTPPNIAVSRGRTRFTEPIVDLSGIHASCTRRIERRNARTREDPTRGQRSIHTKVPPIEVPINQSWPRRRGSPWSAPRT